ncbi:MAG: hypothetical protein IKB71_01235 [Lentisphaeria bacterium]|nr:hypothetical protein [Lentisphaeria bacterium]
MSQMLSRNYPNALLFHAAALLHIHTHLHNVRIPQAYGISGQGLNLIDNNGISCL